MKQDRPLFFWAWVGGALLVVLFVVAAYFQAKEDRENPCVAWGPQRVAYYQQVGAVMMPIYETPCVKRTHE